MFTLRAKIAAAALGLALIGGASYVAATSYQAPMGPSAAATTEATTTTPATTSPKAAQEAAFLRSLKIAGGTLGRWAEVDPDGAIQTGQQVRYSVDIAAIENPVSMTWAMIKARLQNGTFDATAPRLTRAETHTFVRAALDKNGLGADMLVTCPSDRSLLIQYKNAPCTIVTGAAA
ncbi:hypothetical protein AB0N05_34865 [Nocardia sp. NPDC051030]|uniref:hypothetical protein n=1 Tax=Nocardia sp. NPDC051030 TaxID=3155162 RepID=UPI00341792E2